MASASVATTPAAPVAEPRGRGVPAWVAGVVLLGGIVGLALYVWASGVSLVEQHHIHTDAMGVHEVAKQFNEGWNSPDFDPFVENRLRLITPLLTLAYLVSATVLGGLIVRAIRGSEEWPGAVRMLAGFLPGYLMLLAPLQLLFAAVPLVTAAWIAIGLTVAAGVAVGARPARHHLTRLRTGETSRRGALVTAAIVVGVLLLAAVHRVQMGPNFLVTDSISILLTAVGDQLAGSYGTHLAQWDQQADEWLFNAPLMFTSHGTQDFLFPLYVTQFVGLASFGALAFGLVQTFARRRRRTTAALATAAVLLSSPAIFPWFYTPLIGGHDPSVWLGHPGRFVAIAAPWVALLLLGRVHCRGRRIAIGLATAGLAFVTLHAIAYVLFALAVALAWRVLRPRPLRDRRRAPAGRTVPALAAVALLTPVLTYCLVPGAADPSSLAWITVAGVAAAGIGALLVGRLAATTPTDGPIFTRAGIGWSVAWLATLVVGIELSNNLLSSDEVRTLLGDVLPGFRTPLASRQLFGDDLTAGLSFPRFSGEACAVSSSCTSVAYFMADWGLTFLLVGCTWLALRPTSYGRRATWLLMVGAFGASFLITDFTGAAFDTAWIFSRFLEVPYYGLLALATIAFVASPSRLTRWSGGGVLAAWSAVPILVNLVPVQLLRNAEWLLDRLG